MKWAAVAVVGVMIVGNGLYYGYCAIVIVQNKKNNFFTNGVVHGISAASSTTTSATMANNNSNNDWKNRVVSITYYVGPVACVATMVIFIMIGSFIVYVATQASDIGNEKIFWTVFLLTLTMFLDKPHGPWLAAIVAVAFFVKGYAHAYWPNCTTHAVYTATIINIAGSLMVVSGVNRQRPPQPSTQRVFSN